jgi:hypothetical protein
MPFTIPTVSDFKAQFYRDFPYAVPVPLPPTPAPSSDDTDLSKVTDVDIQNGINLSQFNINQALFPTQSMFSTAFLYLAAHYMVETILAGTEGLDTQYNWLTQAKSVDGVSETYVIPERIKKDPMLSNFARTRYGAIYLSIISPQLVGNIMPTHRQTLP